MAVVAVHPGGAPNTFVPSIEATRNMQVDFSRNPKSFALNRWLYIVPVDKMLGLYTRMTVEEAGRILNDREHAWPLGNDAPQFIGRTEKFGFPSYQTKRWAFGYRIPTETAEQASWDILAQHGRIIVQQAMTWRTQQATALVQTVGTWPTGHTAAVTGLTNSAGLTVTGKWDQSTTARLDIKKSLIIATQQIQLATLNAIRVSDLKLVMGPHTAAAIVSCQEVADYIKGSPDAKAYIKNELGPNAYYGLPERLYGYEIVIEDAVKVTSKKGASSDARSFIWDGDKPALLYRAAGKAGSDDDGLVGPDNSNEAPTFSTVTGFVYEDMTVESKVDPDNRVNKGRIVDNYDIEVTAPISGYLFQDVLT
jgi:hypothetical protein